MTITEAFGMALGLVAASLILATPLLLICRIRSGWVFGPALTIYILAIMTLGIWTTNA